MIDATAALPIDDPAWRATLIDFVTETSGLPRARVDQVVEICAAEVAVGRALIAPHQKAGVRILEVGAGIGLLAHDLYRRGWNVVALEPGANGFGFSARIGAAVRAFVGGGLPLLDKPSSALEPEKDGPFDLIFSVNVLEHIPDLEASLIAMLGVLAPGGVMTHTCPNYHVPYEPHYALPLVPGFPQAVTALKPELCQDELWRSLNFITSTRVKRFARRAGVDVCFEPGLLYEAIRRLDDDPQFSERHRGLIPAVYGALKKLGLIHALKYLPPACATPMRFTCRRTGETAT